ncbi:MAG: hypothetical protein H7288_11655 [Kineosporiaceae bacterium]|nr:hypothetical protein [Aeromicrobium sp.]
MTALDIGESPAIVVGFASHEGTIVDFYKVAGALNLNRDHVAMVTPTRMQAWAGLPESWLPLVLDTWEAVKAGETITATHRMNVSGAWSTGVSLEEL